MKTCKSPSDIPDGHHYAIIVFKKTSVHIPGDERSRTNPGHGYPARTEEYTTNEYFSTHNRDEWVRMIETMEKEKSMIAGQGFGKADPYCALEVAAKATIETKVSVGVTVK